MGEQTLGSLTPEEEDKLKQIREDCEPAVCWGHDIKSGSDGGNIVLLKFLRAREFDVAKSLEMLNKSTQWRKQNSVDTWRGLELAPCFDGFDRILGRDLLGRPILLSKFTEMDPAKVFGDLELFVQYRVKWMEEVVAKLSFRRLEPEAVCQIHDYKGVSVLGQPDMVKKAVSASKDVFEANYPEFKGRTIFINFPTVFAVMFKAFTAFFPAKTVAKFVIMGESELYRLYEHLNGDQIPEEYGGFLRQGEEPPTVADTAVWRSVPNRSEDRVSFSPSKGKFGFEVRALSGACKMRVESASGDVLWRSDGEVTEAQGIVQGEVDAAGDQVFVVFDNTSSFFTSKVVAARPRP